jgi:apolipoprotein N-acyltransferase
MMPETAVGMLEPQLESSEQPAADESVVLTPRIRQIRWPRLLPALASGALLWLCYFPVGWTWLAWVALVPLLCLVRGQLPAPAVAPPGERARPARRLVRFFAHPNRRIFLVSWVAGLAFFVPALKWMRVGDPTMYLAWLALAVYCALYFPAAVLIARWFDRRTGFPMLLCFPVIWTAIELARSLIISGFAWYFLAHTQHAFLPFIQIADITGVYGVTFLIAMVNVVLFEILAAQAWFREMFCLAPVASGRGRLIVQFGITLVLLAGNLVYGSWRLTQHDFAPGPNVALVQGNLPQEVKDRGAAEEMIKEYVDLTRQVVRINKPDLIVWPETSFPRWNEAILGDSRDSPHQFGNMISKGNSKLLSVAHYFNIPMLVGANTVVEDCDRNIKMYNSALLLRPGRTSQVDGYAIRAFDFQKGGGEVIRLVPYNPAVLLLDDESMYVHAGQMVPRNADAVVMDSENQLALRFINGRYWLEDRWDSTHDLPIWPGQNLVSFEGRYDKMHRVPVGEFLPFKETLPWLQKLTPFEGDYGVLAGEHFTRFSVADSIGKQYTFGVIICFEDSDAVLSRQYVAPGEPPVDFLLNISNDGWFKGTEEHEEHLALCRFRAIECRRCVARSVNMGISAVIDGNGRIVPPEVDEKDTPGRRWDGIAAGDADLPVSHWADFKKVSGVRVAQLPLDTRTSLYATWGDTFAWSCWGLIGLGGLWCGLPGKRLWSHPG